MADKVVYMLDIWIFLFWLKISSTQECVRLLFLPMNSRNFQNVVLSSPKEEAVKFRHVCQLDKRCSSQTPIFLIHVPDKG